MRSSKNLITIFALSLLCATSALGSGMVFGAGAVHFPNKAAQAGELKVAGPEGFAFSKAFEAGESVSFSLYGADGYALVDGLYKWSLEIQGEATGDREDFRAAVEPIAGVFSIRNGTFVNPNLIESLPNKDQVILDDLIVNGSICAGQDCTNGESFGFDTLRLKENNLRIRAQDTSTSASFPSRDWQITFNDSANGGANKFSIDDIDGGRTPFTIEAGARTNSLFVEDSGQIGIGTDAPVADLHVKTGNTPTLRLEQDGSSGFTAQIWDLAGNEANLFIRDATNGSDLPFRIFPDAGSNALTILGGTGHIGMGIQSAASELHVWDTDAANIQVTGTAVGILLQESDTTNILQQLFSNSVFRMRALDGTFNNLNEGITYNGTTGDVGINCDANNSTFDFTVGNNSGNCSGATAFTGFNAGDTALSNSSSRSLKENLQQVQGDDLLEKIAAIDVYTYDFIDGPKNKLGLIAEDFHQVFGRGSDKMINGGEVQMAMWLAIQELTGQVKQLKAELAAAQTE